MSLVDTAPYAPEPASLAAPSALLPRWLWALTGVAGLGLVVLGLLLVALPFLLPVVFEGAGVVIAGYGLIGVTLGGALGVSGIQGWRQIPGVRFYTRRGWWVFLLMSLAMAIVAMLLPAHLHGSPLFAPFHFALILLPGLFLLSLVTLLSGPDAAVPVRRLVLAAAGGTATIFLAIPVELMGLFLASGIGVVIVSVVPGGAEEVQRLLALLQGWTSQSMVDETEILGLLASPVVLLALAILLGVITPLVEEFGKTLVLGVMGIWVKPPVLVSFVWGVACGLGFAWLEGISNGAMGLGAPVGWLSSVVVRFFATAMHGLTSGLLGIGWAYFWQRKWWMLPLTYAIAVIFHGLWNFNVVLSLGGMGTSLSSPALGTSITVLGFGIQILLIVTSVAALLATPLILRRRARTAVSLP